MRTQSLPSDVVVSYAVNYISFMMLRVCQSSVPYSVGFECFLLFLGDVIFTTESTEMSQTFYRHCHFHPLEELADSSLAKDLTNGMSWHMLCIACLLVQSGHSGRRISHLGLFVLNLLLLSHRFLLTGFRFSLLS